MCRKPIILPICLVLFLSACSTQSDKWANVAYHNTTAHYNVWWNGNESLKSGVTKLEKSVMDDFTQILPVYRLGSKDAAMSIYPEMDRATEKGLKGIKKHSISIKGTERVPYVRKCYLLTAYASFYKQDYVTAANTSQMIMSQYVGTEEADEAAILVARCTTADRQYADAEAALDQLVVLLGQGNFTRSLRSELYMAMAECLLPQEKYKKAVQFLKLAIESDPSREQVARMDYILGQIYQKHDKRQSATSYYEKALKKSQEYVMEFNARLSIASCADIQHSDIGKLERGLDKMLADKKNEEYHDQIYYAKGEMYMGVKDAQKACESFAKSVAVSTANQAQKAKSAIRLADIQYELYENYTVAQRYYDTAMSIIKSDYPRYKEIRSRHQVLSSLVTYTDLIERNDSLLVVSELPIAERMALINDKIKAVKAADSVAKEKELLDQLAQETKAQQNTLQGDWYFYNPNTVQQGKQTFKQRWGVRVLEDFWFLNKKGMLGMGVLIAGMESVETEFESDTTDVDSLEMEKKSFGKNGDPSDPHSIAYYLKDIPTTASQRDSMRNDISMALLNAGFIYYDGLKNIPKSVDCYQRMTGDYPERDEVVQAFYMLYRIYSKQGNTPQANYYKNMVLMGFPDSDYANLIRDEEYYKEIVKRDQLINDEYRDLYDTYMRGRYKMAIQQVRQVAQTYPEHPMLDKFHYWEALSYVRIDSTAQAIDILTNIVNNHPATDSIVPIAQAQLDFLKNGNVNYSDATSAEKDEITTSDELAAQNNTPTVLVPKEEEQLSEEAQMFRYKETLQHYVMIIVNDKRVRSTELQYKIADFNSQYYSNKGYKVNLLMFTDSTQMLTIHRFVDANEAVEYWQHLQQDYSPLKKLATGDYVVYPISTQNYTTFYNRKKIDAYREFFERYYLNK